MNFYLYIWQALNSMRVTELITLLPTHTSLAQCCPTRSCIYALLTGRARNVTPLENPITIV